MWYVSVTVCDVVASKRHQKMFLPLGTNAAAVCHQAQHAFLYNWKMVSTQQLDNFCSYCINIISNFGLNDILK